MAEPKYKLKKGTVRSPEEYRNILSEIDGLQRKRSAVGVHKSKQRIYNTFGISSTQYKKKKKPIKDVLKIKIHNNTAEKIIVNIPKVYCTNLTIHNEPYILLKYNEFGFSVLIDKIKETLEANNTDYYNIRNKVYVSAKGMFHLEMELGHEIEFA